MSARLTLLCCLPARDQRTATFPGAPEGDEAAPGAARLDLPRWERLIHVWTSPARCALRTAAAAGLEASIEPALRDCAYGDWAGRGIAEVEAESPAAVAAWATDPAAAPHGGESVLDLLARVGSWLDARSGDAGHGLAVTHAAVIRAAIVCAVRAAPVSFWHLDVVPLSITELRFHQGRWRLRSMGRPLGTGRN